MSILECVFGGSRGASFGPVFGAGSAVFEKVDKSPGALNISIWELVRLPKSTFSNVYEVPILDTKNRSNVTYTMVSAIFEFRKKVHFGTQNDTFLIVFEVDRKSLRCFIYKRLSVFELSENIDLSCFPRCRFWTCFLFWGAEWAQNAYTSVNWDHPQKTHPPKKGGLGGVPRSPGEPLWTPFKACSGGPNRA